MLCQTAQITTSIARLLPLPTTKSTSWPLFEMSVEGLNTHCQAVVFNNPASASLDQVAQSRNGSCSRVRGRTSLCSFACELVLMRTKSVCLHATIYSVAKTP